MSNEQKPGGSPAQPPAVVPAQRTPFTDSLGDADLRLPEMSVSRRQARTILKNGKRDEKVKLMSQLLSFAEWDDIWRLTDREQARRLFPLLELPARLRRAWARHLDIEDGIEEEL